jgi:hypothetical protein
MSIVSKYWNLLRINFFAPSIKDIDQKYQSLIGFLAAINDGISTNQNRQRLVAGYAARYEIERILGKLENSPQRLEHFGFKVYSQGDEDGILEEIFNRLKIDKGRFCEIGVESGLECNSLYLIHKGWTGLWVEGNKSQEKLIRDKFKSIIPAKLNFCISYVTKENINDILRDNGFIDDNLDFISIDIDGNDIYILEYLDYKPKVICIEYNSKFRAKLKKQQVYNPDLSWQGTDYVGSSLASISDIAFKKGYTLVATNLVGTNAFYVRNDLVEQKFCNAGNYDMLYNPPRYYLLDHFMSIGHSPDFGPYTDLSE